MTTVTDWQTRVGDVWAQEWRRTDRSFADLSRRLDAAILAAAPDRGAALDIGCGAGATSLALAGARPRLRVNGIDLSAPMIAIAGERAAEAGLADRVAFRAAPIESLPPEPGYDLLVSRHGVMFFADPYAAFTHLRSLARPGAALVFSCFADRAANRFATLADDLFGSGRPTAVPDAPGPFAFADHDRVAALLAATGWTVPAATRVDFLYRAGEGDDAIADAADFLSRIGPVAGGLRDLAPDRRVAARARLTALLAGHHRRAAVDLPARAWIWRATAGTTP